MPKTSQVHALSVYTSWLQEIAQRGWFHRCSFRLPHSKLQADSIPRIVARAGNGGEVLARTLCAIVLAAREAAGVAGTQGGPEGAGCGGVSSDPLHPPAEGMKVRGTLPAPIKTRLPKSNTTHGPAVQD